VIIIDKEHTANIFAADRTPDDWTVQIFVSHESEVGSEPCAPHCPLVCRDSVALERKSTLCKQYAIFKEITKA
jgi:hypothetical protein